MAMQNVRVENGFVYFEMRGPIETVKYRTTLDAKQVEFYSEHRVANVAREGWNKTKSATVEMYARKAIHISK